MGARLSKSQQGKNPDVAAEKDKICKIVLSLDSPLDYSKDKGTSIRLGPHTLSFTQAQRIAQQLRASKASSATAVIEITPKNPQHDPKVALYNMEVRSVDGDLLLYSQSWVELPTSLHDILETQHIATLFECTHGCCTHASSNENLAFYSRMGIEIVDRDRNHKCMCIQDKYTCRCRTIWTCEKCPSKLIFSRHQLRGGRMMLVTTNWRNLGTCRDRDDDVWRAQSSGEDLFSKESRRGQSMWTTPEWDRIRNGDMIPYEAEMTRRMREAVERSFN